MCIVLYSLFLVNHDERFVFIRSVTLRLTINRHICYFTQLHSLFHVCYFTQLHSWFYFIFDSLVESRGEECGILVFVGGASLTEVSNHIVLALCI